MPKTSLRTDPDYWIDIYKDVDLDEEDELCGAHKVNACRSLVHAPDVEVEGYGDDDFFYGTQVQQYKAFNEGEINSKEYLIDKDGDESNCRDITEMIERWT